MCVCLFMLDSNALLQQFVSNLDFSGIGNFAGFDPYWWEGGIPTNVVIEVGASNPL